MFNLLWIWFTLIVHAERPWCVSGINGESCPIYPPWA